MARRHVQLTYYAPPERPEPEPLPAGPRPGILWDYTLDDIGRLARVAVQVHWTMAADPGDRYREAYSAVTLALCEAQARPEEHDLIRAGQAAIRDWVRGTHRTHGLPLDGGRETTYGAAVYWAHLGRADGSHETGVVERTALAEIWPLLSSANTRALLAVAACDGDKHAAARLLGMQEANLDRRLKAARREFLRWWHQGESVPPTWRERKQYKVTAPCGTVSAYHRHRRRGEPSCEAYRKALRDAREARKAAA